MPVDMAPGLYGPWLIWPTPGRYGPATMSELVSGYGPSLILLSVLPLLCQKRPKYLIYSRTKINIHEHMTIDRDRAWRDGVASPAGKPGLWSSHLRVPTSEPLQIFRSLTLGRKGRKVGLARC